MNKRLVLAITLIGLIFVALTGCTSEDTPSYQQISAETAKQMMDEQPNAIILDVRTKAEYEDKHIPGALLLPNEEIGTEDIAALPDKEQVILVYCRSGNRSKQAAAKLAALGYKNIYEFGGINSWPYETE